MTHESVRASITVALAANGGIMLTVQVVHPAMQPGFGHDLTHRTG